jgi:hypothetical protein
MNVGKLSEVSYGAGWLPKTQVAAESILEANLTPKSFIGEIQY